MQTFTSPSFPPTQIMWSHTISHSVTTTRFSLTFLSLPIFSGSCRCSPTAFLPTCPIVRATNSSRHSLENTSQELAEKQVDQIQISFFNPFLHIQFYSFTTYQVFNKLTVVASLHSYVYFQGIKQIQVKHLTFLLPLDPSSLPSKPTPINNISSLNPG